METYIKLGSLVHKYKHCKGIFARSKLTTDAIRSKHDDIDYNTSANSSNQKIKLLPVEEVTIDDSEQSQQTISPIFYLERTGTKCIKHP